MIHRATLFLSMFYSVWKGSSDRSFVCIKLHHSNHITLPVFSD